MSVEQGRGTLKAGDMAPLRVDPRDVHLFDRETGAAL